MPRYLTPFKVSLLVLINIYCDSVVPSSAVIPVLAFIVSHVVPSSTPSNTKQSEGASPNLNPSIHDFEAVTNAHASSVPGRTLLDLFLKKLWMINSLDALHVFFNNLPGVLARTREEAQRDAEAGISPPANRILLSRTSPLGAFVRRAQLEFTRLQFHDSVKLWNAFLRFKEPTAATWAKRNSSASFMSFDSNVVELGLNPGDALLAAAYGGLQDMDGPEDMVSTDDIERMLEFLVERLQKYGNRVPKDMKAQLRNIFGASASMPSLSHFVRFFDAWRAGDYASSFDNLHRYFDYTMQTRDKTYYQYALLHMAVVQADFGCFAEAIAAMSEAIATARENQDMSCLNFALSWLNHLGNAYPRQMKGTGYGGMVGSEKNGLTFLKTKAKEGRMWSLLSATLLSEAKMELSKGEGIPHAFERIYQSAHLNITYNLQSAVPVQLLMQSSLYGRLGLYDLSTAYSNILLHCYYDSSPTEEALRALCRNAWSFAQQGQYDRAMGLLNTVEPDILRTLRSYQYITSYSSLIKLRLALRRMDTRGSSHLLHALKSSAVPDPELAFQIALLEIDYHTHLGSFQTAFNKLEDLALRLKEDDADVYQRMHLLTQKALLFAKCGEPQKGFSVALRAAALAHSARVLPALWESMAAVCGLLLGMGEWEGARRVLDAVVPQAIEGRDLALCAQMYSCLADAWMGMAGCEAEGSQQRADKVSRAEGYVDRAAGLYHNIEDVRGECEMTAKKALIARLRGDAKLAKECAERYLALHSRTVERVADEDGAGELLEG